MDWIKVNKKDFTKYTIINDIENIKIASRINFADDPLNINLERDTKKSKLTQKEILDYIANNKAILIYVREAGIYCCGNYISFHSFFIDDDRFDDLIKKVKKDNIIDLL